MKNFKLITKIAVIFSILITFGANLISCSSSNDEIWVYTSTYPDVIKMLETALEKELPNIKVKFFQGGSENVQARIALEQQAGDVKANIVLTADYIWYVKMAKQGFWESYTPKTSYTIPENLKGPNNSFVTNKLPMLVIGYNKKLVKKDDLPKTFKELADPKWKGKISSGSPLESGSNYSLYMNLVYKYGYDHIKKLRQNDIIAAGGNSSTIRRIVTGERPVGMVLLENVLKEQKTNPNIGIVFPKDGVIITPNPTGIVKGSRNMAKVKKVYDFLFSKLGQEIAVKGHVHSIDPKVAAPGNMKPLNEIAKNSFEFTDKYLEFAVKEEKHFKTKFKKIVLE